MRWCRKVKDVWLISDDGMMGRLWVPQEELENQTKPGYVQCVTGASQVQAQLK